MCDCHLKFLLRFFIASKNLHKKNLLFEDYSVPGIISCSKVEQTFFFINKSNKNVSNNIFFKKSYKNVSNSIFPNKSCKNVANNIFLNVNFVKCYWIIRKVRAHLLIYIKKQLSWNKFIINTFLQLNDIYILPRGIINMFRNKIPFVLYFKDEVIDNALKCYL